jgi:hypothetical protein
VPAITVPTLPPLLNSTLGKLQTHKQLHFGIPPAAELGGSFVARPLADKWGLPLLATVALLMLRGLLLTWLNYLELVVMEVQF